MSARTPQALGDWAEYLGWDVSFPNNDRVRLRRGGHIITVYLGKDQRMRSAYLDWQSGVMHNERILGGRDAVIKIMKELT